MRLRVAAPAFQVVSRVRDRLPLHYPLRMPSLLRFAAILGRTTVITLAVAVVASVAAFALDRLGISHTAVFVVSAVALATLAVLIGQGPISWVSGSDRALPGSSSRRSATCSNCSSRSSRSRPDWSSSSSRR